MHPEPASLEKITPYIYGTTRLGDDSLPRSDRLAIAHAAMQSGVWFHTARMYGDALEVLGEAFAAAPSQVPKLVIKIGWQEVAQLRPSIEEVIEPLGVPGVQLGQLCLGGALAEDFAAGGDCFRVFQDLKDVGLVQGFVVEVFPWTSGPPLQALRAGYTAGIIDGFIFYLNPLQRFTSNELWHELTTRNQPMIAMRTVAGGPVHHLRDVPGFAWKPYLQARAVEVAPIFEQSGVPTWTAFCVRFAHSFPQVRATVGATSQPAHLEAFLQAQRQIEPLPDEIVAEITALQSRWSDELDMQAEPWTM
jgi:hypothetical protein